MIDAFVRRKAEFFERHAFVGDKAAVPVSQIEEHDASAPVIDGNGTLVATALDKAQNLHIALAAFGTTARFFRAAHFHIIGFNRLAFAAERFNVTGGRQCQANAMPQKPRGFHAAIEHPLNLPRRNAFFGTAKQVDDLKPQVKRQVAIFEQRAHADREGLLAGVALVQPRAGRLAVQATNALGFRAMRTHRAVRPKPCLDIRKRCGFGQELRGIQDRLGHSEISYGYVTKSWGRVCQV